MSERERITHLRQVLAEIDTELVLTKRSQFRDMFASILNTLEASTVAIGSDQLLDELGVADVAQKAGLGIIGPLHGNEERAAVHEWHLALAGADVGISSGVGLAEETGSVLLPPHQPDERAITLLPPTHLIILNLDQLEPDIGSLFARWQRDGNPVGSAVMVSGPSRTADIEKELVLGVHGPQAVTILLVEPD